MIFKPKVKQKLKKFLVRAPIITALALVYLTSVPTQTNAADSKTTLKPEMHYFVKIGDYDIIETNMDGAAVLLDNDYLNDIHKRFGDYWILPSSIHEILVLPMQAYEKSNGKAYEEARNSLLNMIKEVNDTQVMFQEVLSYSLMKYTSDGLELA